jgi:hypothetical protein
MFNRDFFDEIFPNDKIIVSDPLSNGCLHNFQAIESNNICMNCGVVDIHNQIFVESYETQQFLKKMNFHLYYRKSYFVEKLKLLNCQIQSGNPKYNEMINQLQLLPFKNIFGLKKLMKKYKYNKFYKYIYRIYFDIKNTKLIDLSNSDVNTLIDQFMIIERKFKEKYVGNLFSYNLIIYYLFKKNNYECYKNIIIPKNYNKITIKVLDLLKEY